MQVMCLVLGHGLCSCYGRWILGVLRRMPRVSLLKQNKQCTKIHVNNYSFLFSSTGGFML